ERAARLVQVKRLLTVAIAREQQTVPARVPQRQRKRAAQALHHFLVPVLIGLRKKLGVVRRGERDAVAAELGAQLAGVEDRAIERDRHALGIAERGGHYYGAARLLVDERAERLLAIAMRQRFHHRRERLRVRSATRGCPPG